MVPKWALLTIFLSAIAQCKHHRKSHYIRRSKNSTDYDATVVFFKDDYKFDGSQKGIWSKPQECLNIVSKFAGVATPDFSTNLDFPYPLSIFNTYRMRSCGFWFIKNGLNVVNTVRWGNSDTWSYCFDGIPKNSMVIISTHGCINNNSDKSRYKLGYLN